MGSINCSKYRRQRCERTWRPTRHRFSWPCCQGCSGWRGLGTLMGGRSAFGRGGPFFLMRHLSEFFAWRRLQHNAATDPGLRVDMVQVLAEDDAGAQSPIVDEEPDEAAEGEGVDRRGECSPLWATHVKMIQFYEQARCKSKELQKKLNILRTSIPSTGQLRQILKNHRAWKMPEPTKWDIVTLWRKHPNTTVVRVHQQASRQGVLRGKAQETFGNGPFWLWSKCWQVHTVRDRLRSRRGTWSHPRQKSSPGCVLSWPATLQVNGMLATVQHYDPRSGCLEVATNTGKRLAAHPITEDLPDGRRITLLPARLGHGAKSKGHDVAAHHHYGWIPLVAELPHTSRSRAWPWTKTTWSEDRFRQSTLCRPIHDGQEAQPDGEAKIATGNIKRVKTK